MLSFVSSLKKPVLASAFFYLAVTAHAFAFGSVQAHLQPWSAACAAVTSDQAQSCGQPAALAPEVVVSLDPHATTSPAMASQAWSAGGRMSGVFMVIAVPGAGDLPAYVQIRVEILQPTRALCLTSQKWDVTALVPIICVGFDSQILLQTGVTVTGTLGTMDAIPQND